MRRLYADAYRLPLLRAAPDAEWFELANNAELHVYAQTDTYHGFFGDGRVPGLLVEDFAGAANG